jgi:hypothetical protein
MSLPHESGQSMYPQVWRVDGMRLEREDEYERPSWKMDREVGRGRVLKGRGGGISNLSRLLLGGS